MDSATPRRPAPPLFFNRRNPADRSTASARLRDFFGEARCFAPRQARDEETENNPHSELVVLRQAQHEGGANQNLILSLSKDEAFEQ